MVTIVDLSDDDEKNIEAIIVAASQTITRIDGNYDQWIRATAFNAARRIRHYLAEVTLKRTEPPTDLITVINEHTDVITSLYHRVTELERKLP